MLLFKKCFFFLYLFPVKTRLEIIENVTRSLLQGLIKQHEIDVKLRYFDWPIPVFIRFIEISRIYTNIYDVK